MGKKQDNAALRDSLNSSEYRGEASFVDKDLRLKGPLKNRKCTDVLFVIIFFAFCGLMGWGGYNGMKNGHIESLVNPVDEDGKLCGYDYPDYHFAYYLIQLKLS